MGFSVLISVYEKEDPTYFDESLKSVLIEQSLLPNEVVIIKDGPLTNELEYVINKYESLFAEIVNVVELKENSGLGEALRIGIEKCSFDIIARMDSDDINHYLRFEKQLKILEDNSNVDLVGGAIAEFFDTPEQVEFIRKVPTTNDKIKKMAKRRNPINHVSVMFRKSAVQNAGSYKHLNYLEDYYLWIRMLERKCKLKNIEDILVFVRTGDNMFKRRSNPEYIKSWFLLQKEMKKFDMISSFDFIENMLNIIVFIYMPPSFKKVIYRIFLRVKTV